MEKTAATQAAPRVPEPECYQCRAQGEALVRTGSCRACLNCGSSQGCS
jgi:hypothetical protein